MVSPLTVVHVHDKKGKTHVFGPDDTLPKWAIAAIDNPKVLPARTATAETGTEDEGSSETTESSAEYESSDETATPSTAESTTSN